MPIICQRFVFCSPKDLSMITFYTVLTLPLILKAESYDKPLTALQFDNTVKIKDFMRTQNTKSSKVIKIWTYASIAGMKASFFAYLANYQI